MSVTTSFIHPRPFGFSPSMGDLDAGMDYVDITLDQARAIWWNLESLEFVSAATKGAANVNWTTTFGPIESIPFTPEGDETRGGAYYDAGSPAKEPRLRVSDNTIYPLFLDLQKFDDPVVGKKRVQLAISMRLSPDTPNIRMGYFFQFVNYDLIGDLTEGTCIRNPALNNPPITGTPASSGTISILGVELAWNGGGYNPQTEEWTAETATLSVTSAPFTYP